MKEKYAVTKGHLNSDTRKAKKIISASEKIEKLGEEIIDKDKKTKKSKKSSVKMR